MKQFLHGFFTRCHHKQWNAFFTSFLLFPFYLKYDLRVKKESHGMCSIKWEWWAKLNQTIGTINNWTLKHRVVSVGCDLWPSMRATTYNMWCQGVNIGRSVSRGVAISHLKEINVKMMSLSYQSKKQGR